VADKAFARSLEGWAVEPISMTAKRAWSSIIIHVSCDYTLYLPPGLAVPERLPWTCCPDAPQHTPGSKEIPVYRHKREYSFKRSMRLIAVIRNCPTVSTIISKKTSGKFSFSILKATEEESKIRIRIRNLPFTVQK
jgi:hypothetical protein